MGWAAVVSNGVSGGIIVIWDRRVMELVEECVAEFLVACHSKNVDDGFEWAFLSVYGPNLDSSRSLLWDEMAGLCCWWDLSWCFGGDFNITRCPSD